MNILKPGTGNQSANRKAAIQFIKNNIFEVDSINYQTGNIATIDGHEYHVSAYAETGAAFISTPGEDKSKHSIYESGLTSLMFRQIRGDKRSFIYEVDPRKITVKAKSSSAQWSDIDKAASRVWICTEDQIKLIERRKPV